MMRWRRKWWRWWWGWWWIKTCLLLLLLLFTGIRRFLSLLLFNRYSRWSSWRWWFDNIGWTHLWSIGDSSSVFWNIMTNTSQFFFEIFQTNHFRVLHQSLAKHVRHPLWKKRFFPSSNNHFLFLTQSFLQPI